MVYFDMRYIVPSFNNLPQTQNVMCTNIQPFKILNASAGSGKTYSLVRDYLTILLSDKNNPLIFRHILAITFTNKAVDEMKTRVIKTLKAFASEHLPEDFSAMFTEISQTLDIDEDLLRLRSRKVLGKILYNYGYFNISTIDKFNHSLVRAFAIDLKLSSNFNLEIDAKSILARAVDNVIDKAEPNTDLAKLLVDFALQKMDNDKSWNITPDVRKMAALLIEENHYTHLKTIKTKSFRDFANLRKRLKIQIEAAKKALEDAAKDFFDLIEKASIIPDDFKGSYLPKFFEKVKNGGDLDFTSNWHDNLGDSRTLYNKGTVQNTKDAIDRIHSDIVKIYDTVRQTYRTQKLLAGMYGAIVPFSLLSEVSKAFEAIKIEENILPLSDFNALISETIKDQPVPFIYERLGSRYKHFFIDEFQDTSKMQWGNMIPLVGNALSEIFGQGKTGTLLLVGDPKQAIYRFRGGDPEQCLSLFNKTNSPFQIPATVCNLDTNYRSFGAIVEFNNSLFEYASGILNEGTYKDLYANHSRQNVRKGFQDKGYVELAFINKKEEDASTETRILQTIRKLVDENRYRYKDICILVRTQDNVGSSATFLIEQGVPVTSAEALLLEESPDVNFLNTLLKCAVFPNRETLHLQLAIFIAQKTADYNHDTINENRKLEYLFKNYNFDFNKFRGLSLYEACMYAIQQFNIPYNPHVSQYLQIVFDYNFSKTSSFFEFLNYWEEIKGKASIRSSEDLDAVRIMTIHKSKGLEFPVVIYAYVNTRIHKYGDFAWYPASHFSLGFEEVLLVENSNFQNYGDETFDNLSKKRELDAINLLYVATTRAEQQLYIISESVNNNKGVTNYANLLISYLRHEGKWQDDQLVYTFGRDEITKPNKQTNSPANSVSIAPIVKTPKIARLKPTSRRQNSAEKGVQVHDTLKYLITKEDIHYAINKSAPENPADIENMLHKLVNHPKLKAYYTNAYTIYNERELLVGGKVLRPDRMMLRQGVVTLIDYKTGDYDASYEKQLQGYAKALETLGKPVDCKILVFLKTDIEVLYV